MPRIAHMVAAHRNSNVLSCSLCMLKRHDLSISGLIGLEVSQHSMLLLQSTVLPMLLAFGIPKLWLAHTQDPELEMGKYMALVSEVVEVAL